MDVALNSDIENSLKQEVACAAKLLELLEKEQGHLIRADINGIEATTAEKASLIQKMTHLTQTRHSLLQDTESKDKENAIKGWLEASESEGKASWNKLMQLAESAKELNRINGLLINSHLKRNQHALRTLNQEHASNTYGADGQSNLSTQMRGYNVG